MATSITCPFCGQSDVTRASIVRDRGTVVSNTEATGYSFSASGQVDVTTYYAETEVRMRLREGSIRTRLRRRLLAFG
jgi:hypothetical protein